MVYADAISLEIAVANANSNNAKKQVVRNIVSRKILKKYKLLKYAAKKKNGTNRNKLSKVQNKSLSFKQKKGKAHPAKYDVVSFYLRDDVSTALLENATLRRLQKKARTEANIKPLFKQLAHQIFCRVSST